MDEVRFVGNLQTGHLLPDDLLVITSEQRISRDIAEHLQSAVRRELPGRKVLVMSDGLKIGVVSSEDRIGRIEAKLDALIAALADEDDEPAAVTLDGQPAGGEREQGKSLG